jgi:hypothetical protein
MVGVYNYADPGGFLFYASQAVLCPAYLTLRAEGTTYYTDVACK